MKIAAIGAKGIPAKQGGIERYCEEMYPKLIAQGHSVDLFSRSSYSQQAWFSEYDYKGVRVICLPSMPYSGLDALTSAASGTIAALFNRYDVIHFHALGPALFSWLPKLSSSAKVVVTCHGLDWQRSKWGKLSRSAILQGEKIAVKWADRIIVVSQELQSYFRTTYGIETTYIPTAPATYAESDGQFCSLKSHGLEPGRYILFLGRLVPEKRPDLLLKAFQANETADWKLVFAGGVSDTLTFSNELLKSSAGNPNIVFAGEVQGSCLTELVRGAGLFVLPSDVEGLPLVMLEAMREGIPVLASNIAPHRQLIGTNRGLLFEAGNLDSCIRRLGEAIAEPQKLAGMAQEARDYVTANYTWENITYEHLQVYSRISAKLNRVTNSSIFQKLGR